MFIFHCSDSLCSVAAEFNHWSRIQKWIKIDVYYKKNFDWSPFGGRKLSVKLNLLPFYPYYINSSLKIILLEKKVQLENFFILLDFSTHVYIWRFYIFKL